MVSESWGEEMGMGMDLDVGMMKMVYNYCYEATY